jgi:hypothetical protein
MTEESITKDNVNERMIQAILKGHENFMRELLLKALWFHLTDSEDYTLDNLQEMGESLIAVTVHKPFIFSDVRLKYAFSVLEVIAYHPSQYTKNTVKRLILYLHGSDYDVSVDELDDRLLEVQ